MWQHLRFPNEAKLRHGQGKWGQHTHAVHDDIFHSTVPIDWSACAGLPYRTVLGLGQASKQRDRSLEQSRCKKPTFLLQNSTESPGSQFISLFCTLTDPRGSGREKGKRNRGKNSSKPPKGFRGRRAPRRSGQRRHQHARCGPRRQLKPTGRSMRKGPTCH